MKSTVIVLTATVVCLVAFAADAADLPAATLSGNTLETQRHVITIGENGLPAQIVVEAVDSELPLEVRGQNAQEAWLLKAIGRGPMLREPMTLVAMTDEALIEGTVKETAKLKSKKGGATATATVVLGETTVQLDLFYRKDGAVTGRITYSGGTVNALDLLVPLADEVDTVVVDNPVGEKLQAIPPSVGWIGRKPGVVWGNSVEDAEELEIPPRPGVVNRIYVGTGDRGFTWLGDGDSGWVVDEGASTMRIEKDRDGHLTWRIRLVNKPGPIPGTQKLSFALLTHPVSARPPDHRRQAWLKWPVDKPPATPTAEFATWSRFGKAPALRADSAVVLEAATDYAVLTGPAGGDALSAVRNHTDTYPIAVMRYLAGTQTGNVTRLRSNASDLINPGANPATDRVVLGRALLFDIGLEAAGLAHAVSAANTMSALHEFGFFEGDGQTEFIPFWRSDRLCRFGQEWDPTSLFDDVENPMADVHVSVYRRPANVAGYAKALFVIANEGSQPIRDSLYILDPEATLGGGNALHGGKTTAKLDFAGIPERSDWDPTAAQWISRRSSKTSLEDIEDHGVIKRFAHRDGVESYGPTIFVGAHDFRLLLAVGGPGEKKQRR